MDTLWDAPPTVEAYSEVSMLWSEEDDPTWLESVDLKHSFTFMTWPRMSLRDFAMSLFLPRVLRVLNLGLPIMIKAGTPVIFAWVMWRWVKKHMGKAHPLQDVWEAPVVEEEAELDHAEDGLFLRASDFSGSGRQCKGCVPSLSLTKHGPADIFKGDLRGTFPKL